MNILFITQMYPSKELPQYAVFIEQQAKALISLGHSVEILIPEESGNFYLDEFNGITIYHVPFSLKQRSIFYKYSAKKFVEAVNEEIDLTKYDVYHIHACDVPIIMGTMQLAKSRVRKCYIHYHGYNIFSDYGEDLPRAFFHNPTPIKEKLINKADGVICISKKVEDVVKQRCPNAKTYVVYNGVDIDLFHKTDKAPEDFNITCVANLNKIKGQEYLIEAFKNIEDLHKKYGLTLNIIGRGSEEEKLKELSKDFDNIKFLGYLPYTDVAEIMRNSKIFVLPSFYEGLGCVCLEAMASKIATVACIGAGIDEIISDKVSGVLVEPKSVKSLEDALRTLITDYRYRNKIAKNGYDLVREKYTWINSAEELEKIYKGE